MTNLLLFAILLLIAAVAKKLRSIEKNLMAKATRADLDASLQSFKADLDTQLNAINTAVQAILDKAAGSTDLDFTDEVQALKDAQGKVDGIVSTLPSTPTPVPVPVQNPSGIQNVPPPGGGAPPSQSTTNP